MRQPVTTVDEDLIRRVHRDLQDDLDEELELEYEDRLLDDVAATSGGQVQPSREARQTYFRELFRLQETRKS